MQAEVQGGPSREMDLCGIMTGAQQRAACAHYPAEQSGSGLYFTCIAYQCKAPAETFSESFHGRGRKKFQQEPSAHLLVLIFRV